MQRSLFTDRKHLALTGAVLLAGLFAPTTSLATTNTRTSLTSEGLVPTGVSEVGGIVTDIVGLNGTRVVAQVPASSLFESPSSGAFTPTNPFEIGTQTGFDNSVTNQLGGGIAEMSIRITLFDGDTGPGDFDENENDLLINGFNFGNFSDVATEETSSDGLTSFSTNPAGGFADDNLDTGWFFSSDSTLLSNIFAAIDSTEEIKFELDDVDPGDNFFDFTQGVDNSLINVGSGPVVTPGTPVAVPSPTAALSGVVLLGGLALRRRRRAA